jgi:hypothetical protein
MLSSILSAIRGNSQPQQIALPSWVRFLCGTAAAILYGVSLAYTIRLMLGLASSDEEKVLLALTGFGIDLCKMLFNGIGLSLLARGYIARGLVVLSVGVVVVCVSIGASLGAFSATGASAFEIESKAAARYNVTSIALHVLRLLQKAAARYNVTKQSIESLEASIQSVQSSINTDLAKERLTAARQSTSRLERLQEQKNALLSQLSQPPKATQSSTALFNALSSLFGLPPEKIMARVHLLVSVLLELCGGIAASLAGVSLRVVSVSKAAAHPILTQKKRTHNMHVKHACSDEKNMDEVKQLFTVAEAAKIGESIGCPWCSAEFVKRTYAHRFCSQKHRDNYWNFVKPERVNWRKGQGLKLVRA